MKRRLFLAMAALALLTGPAAADQKVKVGISGGDAELIWAKVKEIAAKDGLDVQVVVFNDYLLPNAALDVGDLDANAFQHKPFLDNQIKARGYKIVAVGETIVAPIGLYSRKAKSVAEIKDGASIGIPNDPSNGGRALRLLQAEKLIELKDGVGILPTTLDITGNPRKLKIREIRRRPATPQPRRCRCCNHQHQLCRAGRPHPGQGFHRDRILCQQSLQQFHRRSREGQGFSLGREAGARLSERYGPPAHQGQIAGTDPGILNRFNPETSNDEFIWPRREAVEFGRIDCVRCRRAGARRRSCGHLGRDQCGGTGCTRRARGQGILRNLRRDRGGRHRRLVRRSRPERREAAMANREKLGGYLQDRRWMARVLDQTYAQSNRLADWGYPYPADENGKSQRNSLQGPEYMRLMRKRTKQAGVTILDHSAGARAARRRKRSGCRRGRFAPSEARSLDGARQGRGDRDRRMRLPQQDAGLERADRRRLSDGGGERGRNSAAWSSPTPTRSRRRSVR